MYNVERQREILDILEKNKSVSVTKLSKLLYVSAPTVRRDITALEREGYVTRTHGGVVLRQTAETEIPLILGLIRTASLKELLLRKPQGI